MYVNKLDNTKFGAGNIHLKRIEYEQFSKSYDAIKKLAEDRNVDIFISKSKESKLLPAEDMYFVIAKTKVPIKTSFFASTNVEEHGIGTAVLSKQVGKEKLSVRIYNAAINAMENLEKRINGLK